MRSPEPNPTFTDEEIQKAERSVVGLLRRTSTSDGPNSRFTSTTIPVLLARMWRVASGLH